MKTHAMLVLLICSVAARGQESQSSPPRLTFERAAYAEEHERDFEKAANLYREAGSVAAFLGDTKLADEARVALRRLEGRMGKGSATRPSQEVPPAVERRLFLLVKQLSSPKEGDSEQKNYDAKHQLVAFGAVAVPILEKALNAETIPDPDAETASETSDAQLEATIKEMRTLYTDNWPKLQQLLQEQARRSLGHRQAPAPAFRGDSSWAARTLSEIDHPDALAALERGLDSPDPVVRKAVLQGDPVKHRKLFDRALKDQSPAVVRVAIGGLLKIDDPSLLEVMQKALASDEEADFAAAEWLVRVRPDVAFEALKGSVPSSSRGFQAIVEFWFMEQFKVQDRMARMVEAAEANPDARRVLDMLAAVQSMRFNRTDLAVTEPLRQRSEALALRILGDGEPRNENHWRVLNGFGRLPTVTELAKRLPRRSRSWHRGSPTSSDRSTPRTSRARSRSSERSPPRFRNRPRGSTARSAGSPERSSTRSRSSPGSPPSRASSGRSTSRR
jgi:hypothetical protein